MKHTAVTNQAVTLTRLQSIFARLTMTAWFFAYQEETIFKRFTQLSLALKMRVTVKPEIMFPV